MINGILSAKVNKFIAVLFFAFTLNIYSQNVLVDSLFASGNSAYQNKNYEKAIEKYEKIINEGYASPELFYNLGNAYYKIGAVGKAILNYERALLLDPSNEDVKYNLKIANARIVDKINPVPKFFLTKWKDALLQLFSIDFLVYSVVVLFVLFLLFLFLFRYGKTPSVKKNGFTFGSVVLVLLLFFGFLLYGKNQQMKNEKYGIVLAKEVTVRVSPDENAKARFVIHEGTKIQIEDKVGDWVNIKLADGKKGWMKKEAFEPIDINL